MPGFICCACGTQYQDSDAPPPACPICEDPRQFVPEDGQRWTTLEELRASHRIVWRAEDAAVTGIGIAPHFAIGQRALLIETGAGNILWDCIALLDDALVERIRGRGPLLAIAISHPHYYTTLGAWADAFGVPVYLHADDRDWVQRPHPAIVHWSGESLSVAPACTLVRVGAHFPGATVLHWAEGADGAGALFSGDLPQVVPDLRHVSFLWSYPNLVPVNAAAVTGVRVALAPFSFERIYGAFWGRVIRKDGRAAFDRSVARYLAAIA